MWGKLFGDFIIAEHPIYTYTFVTTRRPDLKADIDAYLTQENRQDLIV